MFSQLCIFFNIFVLEAMTTSIPTRKRSFLDRRKIYCAGGDNPHTSPGLSIIAFRFWWGQCLLIARHTAASFSYPSSPCRAASLRWLRYWLGSKVNHSRPPFSKQLSAPPVPSAGAGVETLDFWVNVINVNKWTHKFDNLWMSHNTRG